jgi:hypothetical protein
MIRFGRDSDLSPVRRRVVLIQIGKIAVRIVIHHGQTVHDNTLGEGLIMRRCHRVAVVVRSIVGNVNHYSRGNNVFRSIRAATKPTQARC